MPDIRRCVITRRDLGTNLEAVRREDVALLAIAVLEQCDAGSPVRIVLDRSDLGHDAAFPALEIDLAVFLFVTAADMPRSQTALVVAAAASFLRLGQTLDRLGLRFGHFLEHRKRLK